MTRPSSASYCLQDLERLSQERSAEKRRELLHRITDLFLVTEPQQSPSDKAVFCDVMQRVAYALESDVRAELAERLARVPGAPKGIVKRLAHDEIAVAAPVLTHSEVLEDEDLIEIAKQKGDEHLLAMSTRRSLSPKVTDVIVARGSQKVLETVASNEGARFSHAGFDTLITRAGHAPSVCEALLKRPDTPEDALRMIRERVAETLKKELVTGDNAITEEDIDQALADSVRRVDLREMERALSLNETDAKADRSVAALHKAGLLNETRLMKYARRGQLPETVQALALLSDLSVDMVRYCLFDAEVPALGVLCRALGFSRESFATLLQLRASRGKLPVSLIVTALKRYDSLTVETARRILRFLKIRLSNSLAESGKKAQAS